MTQDLGILGGGQLGRMLAVAARQLGMSVTVVDPSASAPAQAVATHICAEYDDERALCALRECSWVTFEFENIPDHAALLLEQSGTLSPPTSALRIAQDRLLEKRTFKELGIATTEFREVNVLADAEMAFSELGPMILKTRRFGYDGKGQARVQEREGLSAAFESLKGAPAIAEQLVPFNREISVIICRDKKGHVEIYPLTQNIHRSGILAKSIAPAPDLPASVAAAASDFATRLVTHFSYVGVLALELFIVGDQLVANEFAPRVHNSGHWTIEGAVTSQFENHVRAVCGLPLGSARLRCPSVMLNLIGSLGGIPAALAVEDCHVHNYGKSEREGRKVGHVTCLGTTAEMASERAFLAADLLPGVPDLD